MALPTCCTPCPVSLSDKSVVNGPINSRPVACHSDICQIPLRAHEIFLVRDLRSIDGGLHPAEADKDLLVAARGVVREIDRQNLRTLLVRQSQQGLYLVELVAVFALVE